MALYHKHRPQTFADVVGQDHIVQTISNQILNQNTAHAYLFSGPRGVGKTTTARLLAKALTCPNRKEFEPCNNCDSCNDISASRSIDVIEIDAASHTGVDHVRENIIENAQFRPTSLPYKVFIIDEVHMLSSSAFNALLKTLEEPPSHVLFILATTEPHKLPETIISRCQRFTFKKVMHETMKSHLEAISKAEGISVEPAVLDRIINKGDGCVRDAVSLLDQLLATGEKKITVEQASLVLPTTNVETTTSFIESLVQKQAESGLNQIAELSNQGTYFPQFAIDLTELLRIMMIAKATGQQAPGVDISEKAQKKLSRLTSNISYPELVALIDLVMKRKSQIQSAPLPQLPLELLVIEWCEGAKPDIATMEARPIVVEKTVENTLKDEASVSIKIEETPIAENDIEPVVETISEDSKPSLKEAVKKMVSKEPMCSVAQAQKYWDMTVSKMEEISPSLVFILKMAELTDVHGHTFQINVPYSFHKDKIMDKTVYKQICDVAADIVGTRVELDLSVVEAEREAPSADIEELAAAFGGEVVQ